MTDNKNTLIEKYLNTFADITHLSQNNIHIFDLLLGLQKIVGLNGDILEVGVLQASTASLLATSLEKEERIFLIDPYQNIEQNRSTICQFALTEATQLIFLPLDSMFVAKRYHRFFEPYNPNLRLIHIDGEHSYDGVYSDLGLAYQYLKKEGLIILDDIFNINSACCTHAMFDYLRDNPNLHLVAIAFNKAYLCESKVINFYRKFFLQLPDTLEQEANLHVRVSFNSWSYERSYVTLTNVEANEAKYQIINQRFHSLEDAVQALDINI